ncbi:MAG: hypothetical protein M3Y23_06180, partial [Actinomycetota bacterium]|nr:hypothetical protein [Actinomycetota bacterium]
MSTADGSVDVSAGVGGGGAFGGTAAAAAGNAPIRPGSSPGGSKVRWERSSGEPAGRSDALSGQPPSALTRDGRRPKSSERDRIIAATLDVVA